MILRNVDHTIVLHVATRTDHDRLRPMVTSEDGSVPHTRLITNDDIADQDRSRRDEGVVGHLRLVTVKRDQHGESPSLRWSLILSSRTTVGCRVRPRYRPPGTGVGFRRISRM